MGTVYEAETDKYLPTPLSKALTQLVYQDAFPTWSVIDSVRRERVANSPLIQQRQL